MAPRIESFPLSTSQTPNSEPLQTLRNQPPPQPLQCLMNPPLHSSTQGLLENPFLRGVYNVGSWVERTSKSLWFDSTQTTLSAPGAYTNTQIALNEKYLDQALKRTPLPWLDKQFFDDHFPSEFKPSPAVKIIARAGQGLDAVTGVLNLTQEFKKDIDNDNFSLSNTLHASLRSVGQISAAGVLGTAAAGLVAGTAAPLVVGAAAGIAAGYAAGYVYDSVRGWLDW